jgi:hypothetical protein
MHEIYRDQFERKQLEIAPDSGIQISMFKTQMLHEKNERARSHIQPEGINGNHALPAVRLRMAVSKPFSIRQ